MLIQLEPWTYFVELCIAILRISKVLSGSMIHKSYQRILLVTDLSERMYCGQSGMNGYHFVNKYLNLEANIGNPNQFYYRK